MSSATAGLETHSALGFFSHEPVRLHTDEPEEFLIADQNFGLSYRL
jgi:hypothetical protein